MNKLNGKIIEIRTHNDISIIKIEVGTTIFSSMIIETPQTAPHLKVESRIKILFNETEVIIGKNIRDGISIPNQMECSILDIEKGKLLSKVTLKFDQWKIVSILDSQSLAQLNIAKETTVTAMVKSNEIMLLS